MSKTEDASDYEDPADLQNDYQKMFERRDLQPFFKQLVKVDVSEALQEHDARVKRLENSIGDKNYQIRELHLKKAILEDQLNLKTNTTGEKEKMQIEINRLNKEIEEKTNELISLNQHLDKEKRLINEKDDKITQLKKERDDEKAQLEREREDEIALLEKEKNAKVAQLKKEKDAMMIELTKEKEAKAHLQDENNHLKVAKQQALSQKNVAVKLLNDLKKIDSVGTKTMYMKTYVKAVIVSD